MDELTERMYKMLQLPDTASENELKEKYNELIKRYQAEQTSDDPVKRQEAWVKLKEISAAYEIVRKYLSENNKAEPERIAKTDFRFNQPPAKKIRKPGHIIAVSIVVLICMVIGYYAFMNKKDKPVMVAHGDVRLFTTSR